MTFILPGGIGQLRPAAISPPMFVGMSSTFNLGAAGGTQVNQSMTLTAPINAIVALCNGTGSGQAWAATTASATSLSSLALIGSNVSSGVNGVNVVQLIFGGVYPQPYTGSSITVYFVSNPMASYNFYTRFVALSGIPPGSATSSIFTGFTAANTVSTSITLSVVSKPSSIVMGVFAAVSSVAAFTFQPTGTTSMSGGNTLGSAFTPGLATTALTASVGSTATNLAGCAVSINSS